MNQNNYDAINIYYKNYFAEIGGIETMTYNLLAKYAKKKDILVLYQDGNVNQLKRLNEVGRIEKYDPNKTYRCKKLFLTYETFAPKNIIADKYARVSHGDLFEITKNGWKPPKEQKITEDYGVSKNTCKSVEWYFKTKCNYCPNPFVKLNPKPLLKLISPQRMTWEKGKERIKKFAQMLDEHEIPFQWLIMCNDYKQVADMNNPSIIWAKSRLDISSYLKDADYLVLLSDCEGCPMSPQEALMLGIPIIVSNLPCYKDLNINKNHGFFLELDLSNLDVEEIYKRKGTFNINWKPPKDIWGEILEDGKPTEIKKERGKPMSFIKVKATNKCKETATKPAELDHIPEPNEEFQVSVERAVVLQSKGLVVMGNETQTQEEPPKTDETIKAENDALEEESEIKIVKKTKAKKK